MNRKISIGVAVILPALCVLASVQQVSGQKPIQQQAEKPIQQPIQQPEPVSGVKLTVQVTELKHAEGQLLIGVFSQDIGFPREIEKALVSAKIKPGQPTHTFENLPQGNYAVVVIHDRNKSGQLDRNLIGMPKEPVGLSNYASIGLSNPPTFRKASFTLKTSGLLKVKLNPF